MVCLGFKPGVAGWKAQTNPLSYCGTPMLDIIYLMNYLSNRPVNLSIKSNNLPMFATFPTNSRKSASISSESRCLTIF